MDRTYICNAGVGLLCLCICGFKSDTCFVLICSPFLHLLVHREGCDYGISWVSSLSFIVLFSMLFFRHYRMVYEMLHNLACHKKKKCFGHIWTTIAGITLRVYSFGDNLYELLKPIYLEKNNNKTFQNGVFCIFPSMLSKMSTEKHYSPNSKTPNSKTWTRSRSILISMTLKSWLYRNNSGSFCITPFYPCHYLSKFCRRQYFNLPENMLWHYMQIVSLQFARHVKSIFWKKERKDINILSSAENISNYRLPIFPACIWNSI